jgi:hypothetical protein
MLIEGRGLSGGPPSILLDLSKPILNKRGLGQGPHEALLDITFSHGRDAGRKEIGDLVHLELEQGLIAAQEILLGDPGTISLESF